MTRGYAPTSATLAKLGFHHVTAALADKTSTTHGRELALALEFLPGEPEVRQALTRLGEARAILDEHAAIPVAGAADVRELVARAAKGAVLMGEELRTCHGLLRASVEVRAFLRARRERLLELGALAEELSELGPLAGRLDYMLEPSGEVRDQASEILALYRRRARGIHAEARRRIDAMLNSERVAPYLQDSYFSVRQERYVLPVAIAHRAQVPGIVHNASQTGQTLFIEPSALVELGNELAIAEALIREEERRILAELSLSLGDREEEITRAVQVLAKLDLIQASARLAEEMRAVPALLAAAEADLKLCAVRHPLLVLQGKKVVANDLFVCAPRRGLIICGPNAGGKTVCLTACGLCVLMTRAGLAIPAAEGSVVPLFDGVMGVIGDAQDLGRDLSTFSAHMTALREALDRAAPGWLVLIDEIAADTDPAQGAALGRATLEELVQLGARVLVTTHLDEIKALGLTDERFANASVGVDEATLLPTYHLLHGAVGSSRALDVATRVGLPEHVVARARSYLLSEGALAQALERLLLREQAARVAEAKAEAEGEKLAQARAELTALRQELVRERRELMRVVHEEVAAELAEQRAELSRLTAELIARPSLRAAEHAKQQVDELARATKKKLALLEEGPASTPQVVTVGAFVEVLPLGQKGRVIDISGKHATIEIGALRTRARLCELVVTTQGKASPPRRRGPPGALVPAPLLAAEARAVPSCSDRRLAPRDCFATRRTTKVGLGPIEEDNEGVEQEIQRDAINARGNRSRCDVRGLRADEAQATLERFLDKKLLEGQSTVIIVHGHGNGVLKQIVREALRDSPYVASFRPGERYEGGDGATVVELK